MPARCQKIPFLRVHIWIVYSKNSFTWCEFSKFPYSWLVHFQVVINYSDYFSKANLQILPQFHERGSWCVNMTPVMLLTAVRSMTTNTYVQQSPWSCLWVRSFWGITGDDPTVFKTRLLHVHWLQFVWIENKMVMYSTNSSYLVANSPVVLNLNDMWRGHQRKNSSVTGSRHVATHQCQDVTSSCRVLETCCDQLSAPQNFPFHWHIGTAS